MKNLVILGSTGSIGTQTLDVVRQFKGRFRILGLAARKSLQLLAAQVDEFHPLMVSCEGTEMEKTSLRGSGCEECSMEDMVRHPDVDLVVMATVGDIGLRPMVAAIQAGKNVALANKEPVVMAGEMLMQLARRYKVALLPVDSEPSAIWQCLRGEDRGISRLLLTASGGAFRDTPIEKLAKVTPKEALNHPTWRMGPKITVDSATLMNKAFEVIEARWMFDVPWERIQVVIHPQSIIHSMVEFVDGSVKAQISPPDMRLPIQYALFYPDRVSNEKLERFDPVHTGALTFKQWDPERYPCFKMALEVARQGDTWPAVLSGADDTAVESFLAGRIGFLDIGPTVARAIENHQPIREPTIDEIISASNWAKARVKAILRG